MSRKTNAFIHLDAIISNYQLANKLCPDSKNIAVIKANAYGHGSAKVAQILEPLVPAFAVAIIEEAVSLRNAGITKPILILQGLNEASELEYAATHNLWLMVVSKQQSELIIETQCSAKLNLWLKFDTGMHRLGLNGDELSQAIAELNQCSWVQQKMVLCTHLACASDPQITQTSFTHSQLSQFFDLFNKFKEQYQLLASVANSAGIMNVPEARCDWNRPGIMLYGLTPFDGIHERHELTTKLKPAMTFTSTVIAIRTVPINESVGYGAIWTAKETSTIATIAVGYADGYPRAAKNGTPVFVQGQIAKLAGRVSMDMITVDISECDGIKVGDEVELWGKNIHADVVASSANTIGYDLITGVSQRVPRIFSD